MKSPKLYIIVVTAAVCCMLVTGCLEGPDNTYNGPTVAAFKMQSQIINSVPDGKPGVIISLQVQIIRPKSGKLSQELPVKFKVVDSLTTATTPADYTIKTPSPVTVPADCLRTHIVILYDGSTIPIGDAHILTLQLLGNKSRGVKGGKVVGKYKLTIVGQ